MAEAWKTFDGVWLAHAARVVQSAAAVMVNGTTIFTITGGPIKIEELVSRCVTDNDDTASTLQWQCDPEGDPSAATFSGASASLADLVAGDHVVLNMTALATAPDVVTGGVSLGGVQTRGIILPPGLIKTVIGVGSTTGTWQHFLRYKPLALGVGVTVN